MLKARTRAKSLIALIPKILSLLFASSARHHGMFFLPAAAFFERLFSFFLKDAYEVDTISCNYVKFRAWIRFQIDAKRTRKLLNRILNDQKLRSFVKPACLVSFPWYSILLQCNVHIMGRFSVIFMRRKRVKSILLFHVLENCAVRFVSRWEERSSAFHCYVSSCFGAKYMNKSFAKGL